MDIKVHSDSWIIHNELAQVLGVSESIIKQVIESVPGSVCDRAHWFKLMPEKCGAYHYQVSESGVRAIASELCFHGKKHLFYKVYKAFGEERRAHRNEAFLM
ncbi:hypothetical protein [Vibrio sp. C8]